MIADDAAPNRPAVLRCRRGEMADLLTEKIPPYFADDDRSILQELLQLLRRSETDIQATALTAAAICCIENMDRAYIEARPGVHIKLRQKKVA